MSQNQNQIIRKIGGKSYRVNEVILHCAAINSGQFERLNAHQVRSEIDRWHIKRGMTGFGYHGLIMPDGEFLRGRSYWSAGAHCRGKNLTSIGFLLIETQKITSIAYFNTWFTVAQKTTLDAQLEFLGGWGVMKVSGHNDYANRLCPGFRAADFVQGVV